MNEIAEPIVVQPPTLREVQHTMAAWILNPGGSLESTNGCAWIAAAERLHVYAGGYPVRIGEALAESFPAVAHLVGAGAFAALVRRYAQATALRSYNLNDAGAALADFLRADRLATDLPFLADLARLEWAIASAFHAHEQSRFDPSTTISWTPEDWQRAVLHFQPSLTFIASEWPIRQLWELRDTPIEAIDLDFSQGGDQVLVRRSGDAVMCESIDDNESHLLELLMAGQPLGNVIAALDARGVDPVFVSDWFARRTVQGLVVALRRA